MSKQNVGFALTVGTLTGVICLIPAEPYRRAAVEAWADCRRNSRLPGRLHAGAAAGMPVVFGAEELPARRGRRRAGASDRRHQSWPPAGAECRRAWDVTSFRPPATRDHGRRARSRHFFQQRDFHCGGAAVSAGLSRCRGLIDEIDYIRARNATKRDDSFDLQKR
jgi:hypothetical protein